MTVTTTPTPEVEYALMSDLLKEFRVWLEEETGLPIAKVELNGALLLLDLCQFLGLNDKNQKKVLGSAGQFFTHSFVKEHITLRGRAH